MPSKIEQILKARDLRNNILFVLVLLAFFRLMAHIPIPGVNAQALTDFLGNPGNQVFGLLSLFSGGGMEKMSIVTMGVAPYITASIIFQLLGMIVPKFEEMNKEESGRAKINQWTRWLTVPIAMLQSYSVILLLQRSSSAIFGNISLFGIFVNVMTITAGTVVLMWMGEIISEKKIGNGISIMIFAGIISGLVSTIAQLIGTYDQSMLFTVIAFALVVLATVVGVVVVNEAQRNIPVQYARQIRGARAGGVSHLPLRVNMAGVMPIIFAVSIITLPQMIAQFFTKAQSVWLQQAAEFIIKWSNHSLVYGLGYFVLVFGFTYFYTEIIFHPKRIAENLQNQGGFIPGIRPGRHTTEYLTDTVHKIVFGGALFLALIAVLPMLVRLFAGNIPLLTIGGTSILIVVSVVIESIKQIEAQLSMREYDTV
jgi:preprotein translocase subunit SecY